MLRNIHGVDVHEEILGKLDRCKEKLMNQDVISKDREEYKSKSEYVAVYALIFRRRTSPSIWQVVH